MLNLSKSSRVGSKELDDPLFFLTEEGVPLKLIDFVLILKSDCARRISLIFGISASVGLVLKTKLFFVTSSLSAYESNEIELILGNFKDGGSFCL